MMAKSVKIYSEIALNYPMIQFLLNDNIRLYRVGCNFSISALNSVN